MPPVGYIAYIDEAGDAGLKKIRTRNTPGASEWLVMSAVLMRAEREGDVSGWVNQMLASLDHLRFDNCTSGISPSTSENPWSGSWRHRTSASLCSLPTKGTRRGTVTFTLNGLALIKPLGFTCGVLNFC
jgi:hypothetical protein